MIEANICQKSFQPRTIHVATCETSEVVVFWQAHPALGLLALDVGLGRYTLGVESVELLVTRPFLCGLASINVAVLRPEMYVSICWVTRKLLDVTKRWPKFFGVN